MWHSFFNLPYRFTQHIKHRLQGTTPSRMQLPMAIMLDETQAYKPDHTPDVAPNCGVGVSSVASTTAMTSATHAANNAAPTTTPSQPRATPVQTLHRVLRGTPAQICNELDALVAQEALQ